MDTQNNIFGWVVSVLVVAVIIAGIWWFVTMNPAMSDDNTNATTTPQVATTTQTNTPPAVGSEVRTSSTVAGVIASLSNASRFVALYNSTGVAASVTGKGPFTVFIPTNGAYDSLSPGTLAGMTAAQKKRLVQYHVVVGKMLDLDAVSSGTHTALSKDKLNFNVNMQSKVAFVNSGYAITQYKASNGIVYVISAVLVPPQTPDASTGSTGTPTP